MVRGIVLLTLFCLTSVAAQEDSRTLIGPRNPELADGAAALLSGDVDAGIKLTLAGLAVAAGREERLTGFANLCAAYVLKQQMDTALDYCNRALALNPRHWRSLSNRAIIYIRLQRYDEAEADIQRGQKIRPEAEQLKEVRGLLRDALEPVEPEVTIHDNESGGK